MKTTTMRLGDLKPGDKFVDVYFLVTHYGNGVVLDFKDVPEESSNGYGPDDWVWTKLDLYRGQYEYILGISHSSNAVVEIKDEPDRVVNTSSFCSCANPDLKENYAGGNRFFVCRNCRKERL